MNKTNALVDRIKVGLAIGLLTALTGCVGYVDGGYGGVVEVPGPDVYLFGGGYDRGRDVHDYGRRGGESRAVAHPSGGGHPGGGARPSGGGGHPSGGGGGHPGGGGGKR